MLVGCVIQDEVHDDADAAAVGFCRETIEVLERSETRIDGAVIHDIIAEVMHGRGIERRQPDGIDVQRVGRAFQVIQPADDAREVADPVPVGILKRPGVDLIDDG